MISLYGICKQCLSLNVKLKRVDDERGMICVACHRNERIAKWVNRER